MIQHSTTDTQPDLIPHEEFNTALPRALLIPWWIHVCLSVVVFLSFVFGSVCFGLIFQMGERLDEPAFRIGFSIGMSIVVLLCYSITAGCILMWCRWKHAVAFMIVQSGFLAVFMVFATVGTIRDRSWDGLVFAVVFLVFLSILTIHLFKVRKEWKAGKRK
ncbi:hypothetical protein [Chitinophaga deserti]|uniref:hypothetical protein n=1 Tax=Chitinophaga deserti TaxID=2164099 RepID=UPI0013004CC6|nr:hypothetical protein [Chitinophaga deserti]